MSVPEISSNLPPSDSPALLASSAASPTSPAHSSTSSSNSSDSVDSGLYSRPKRRRISLPPAKPSVSLALRDSGFDPSFTVNPHNQAQLLADYQQCASQSHLQGNWLQCVSSSITGSSIETGLQAKCVLFPGEIFVGVTCVAHAESSPFTLHHSRTGCMLHTGNPHSARKIVTYNSLSLNAEGSAMFPYSQYALPSIQRTAQCFERSSQQDMSIPNAIRIMFLAPDDGTGVTKVFTMIGIARRNVPSGHLLIFKRFNVHHWANRSLSENWFNWSQAARRAFMAQHMSPVMQTAYFDECEYHDDVCPLDAKWFELGLMRVLLSRGGVAQAGNLMIELIE